MNLQKFVFVSLALFLGSFSAVYGQTGKIAGQITDAATEDPLPGVNVVLEGTTQGATTNAEGRYSIINVSPGTYTVRATFVGYADQVTEGVDVNIDLTTNLDIALQEQAVGLDEVTVQAEQKVVKKDISANVSNLNTEDLENVASTSSLEEVVGLTAGVQGLNVRGSDVSQLNLSVDGMTMRNGRTNSPFTGVSYTGIKEVQVQTGGFNAEYGNVRSGLINVVTKEGPRDHYTVDVLTEYSSPSQKHFGPKPNSRLGYHMRPYLDDPDIPNEQDPAFVGTHSEESIWDIYTQRQYPRFDGYNNITPDYEGEDHDLTPAQIQEVFRWYHRKSFQPATPDYVVDGSFGGPVPFVSEALGDLRFFASYRGSQNAYIVPMEREAYKDRTVRLKLTSNLGTGMKLTLQGMYGEEGGHMTGFAGVRRGGLVSCCAENAIFANNKVSVTDITHTTVGGEFTHTLSPNTFYEVALQRNASDYFAYPGPPRDTETVLKEVGTLDLTETPFGWYGPYVTFLQFTTGAHEYALDYDSSNVATWTGSFDLTSQIDQYNQVKAGVDLIYNNQDMNFDRWSAFITSVNRHYQWNENPLQGAAYVQDKLEFEGLVANVGVRLDYFNPNTRWYQYGPFDRALSAAEGGADELGENLEKEPVASQLVLSPRLGVSFPITTASKLFFNYGHFRQMVTPDQLYRVDASRTNAVVRIGNPNHPMPNTVSYELGYEQSFFNTYLVRITGYYKALENQSRNIYYSNIDNTVGYSMPRAMNYGDIRGAEVTIDKNSGKWVQGFANLTYMSQKGGNFGFGRQYENRRAQREYERQTLENLQWTPVARPYARLNLRFLTPPEFGPELLGTHLLQNWTLSWLGSWQKGGAITWDANTNIPGLENNLRWRDDINLDLRITRDVTTSAGDVKFFVDVSNLTNYKSVWGGSFYGSQDYEFYMKSLHISEDAFAEAENGAPYNYIPGNDKPGDYRKPGVEFVPIEVVEQLPDESTTRTQGHYGPLYYTTDEQEYYVWDGGSFTEADNAKVEQVLEDKAYIDMPNIRAFRLLNPRDVTFGVRLTF